MDESWKKGAYCPLAQRRRELGIVILLGAIMATLVDRAATYINKL
jgi:hypothetical protein